MATQTQTPGGPAAAAPASSAGASNSGGSQNQPTGDQTVDADSPVEDGRNNAGQDDAANGSDAGENQRRRPTRVERRIGKLTQDLKKSNDLEAENQRLRQLLETNPDFSQVKLPDYAGRESVTPEEIKSDIITAADQIVKLRMGQILPEHSRNLNRQQTNDRAVADIEAAVAAHPELDPDSESYDPDLEQYLSDTFQAAYAGNPNYRFKDLAETTFKLRGKVTSSATNDAASDTTKDNRSRGAIRSGGSSKAAGKAVEDMTASEYRDYLKSRK